VVLDLRLREVVGDLMKSRIQVIEDPPDPELGDCCYGCNRLERMPTKKQAFNWLYTRAKKRYPNLTKAQFKTKLLAWLDNHPNVRDALPDGEGW